MQHRNRPRMIRTHMYIQISALVFSMIGLAAQFSLRYITGKPHFNSLHSWIGVAALFGLQIVSVFGLLLFFAIPKAKRYSMPGFVAVHKFVSCSANVFYFKETNLNFIRFPRVEESFLFWVFLQF